MNDRLPNPPIERMHHSVHALYCWLMALEYCSFLGTT